MGQRARPGRVTADVARPPVRRPETALDRHDVLPTPPAGWADLPFFAEDWPRIAARLAAEPGRWYPAAPDLFRALDLTPPETVRAVILGQDPYPSDNRATGLAFAYPPGRRPTHSLRNILTELEADTGAARPDGDLTGWARQGVLLLNVLLSVPEGRPRGHASLGWQRLARQVVDRSARRPVAFLLWGKDALDLVAPALESAPETDRLVLASAHPSPMSARRGFFGSRPFSRVNAWLAGRGEPPIDWSA